MPSPPPLPLQQLGLPIVQQGQLKRLSDALDAPSSKIRKTASTRTGQACDRCKVRKIRCDARPGGCSPCLQNNTECKATDRITGRTTSRGHTEVVEIENVNLRMYVTELQGQLKQHGIEPPPPPPVTPVYAPPTHLYRSWEEPSPTGFPPPLVHEERHPSIGSLLPEFRADCIGDNYLGVASENNWLSPIEGTALALFGTKIDLTDFMPPEPNTDATASSYQTFLAFASGRKKLVQVPDLPSYDQCRQYAEWYFRSIQVFIPVLQKSDFMRLLARIYQEGHQPNPAETVMVHMMLTIMYFQYSARNDSQETRQMSFEHYHYSLSFIPDLMMNHKFEDIQALAMICSQLRNQPRPGASWMFSRSTLALAIESGLHRSAKAWPDSVVDPDTVELRKRVFWTLMLFDINCSGHFGRPMPMRFEDFDVEMPEPVSDCMPEERTTLTPWKQCSFRAGLEGFKLLKIMMRIYSTIYAVNPSSSPYDVTVQELARELRAYQDQLPSELAGGSQTIEEDRISALFLQLSIAECQLLLHHPATCRTSSPQVYASNLDVCLEASNKMMVAATQLKELKGLDTTLYYATDFLAAICTTIFIHTERKSQLSQTDLLRLRSDMDTWLDILGPVGEMLGTGTRLQQFMGGIVDRHVNEISRHIAAQTASAAVASVTSTAPETPFEQPAKYEQPPTDYYSAPYTAYPAPPGIALPIPAPQAQAGAQPVPLMPATTSFDPAAWRNFADGMMSGVPAQSGLAANGYTTAPSLTAPSQAAFGAMAMPDTSQAWPMVQWSNMPHNTEGNGSV